MDFLVVSTSTLVTLIFTAAGWFALSLFNVHAFGRLSPKFAVLLILIFAIEAAVGSIVGWHVFKKIERTAVVKRIQGWG